MDTCGELESERKETHVAQDDVQKARDEEVCLEVCMYVCIHLCIDSLLLRRMCKKTREREKACLEVCMCV